MSCANPTERLCARWNTDVPNISEFDANRGRGFTSPHLTISLLGDGPSAVRFDRKTSRSKGLAFTTYSPLRFCRLYKTEQRLRL